MGLFTVSSFLACTLAIANAGVVPFGAPFAYSAAPAYAPAAYASAAYAAAPAYSPAAYAAAPAFAPAAYAAAPAAYAASPAFAQTAYATAPVFARQAPLVAAPAPVLAAQRFVAPAPLAAVRELDDAYPQYQYGYSVEDGLTGDSKAQEETRDGDVVRGSYSLIEPDGVRRTVNYYADPINGFNAVVSRDAPVLAAAPVVPAKVVAV